MSSTVYSQKSRFFTQETVDFLQAYANLAAAAMTNARLLDQAQRLYADLQQSNVGLVTASDCSLQGWSRALDLRDHDTEGHTERVAESAAHLARGYPRGLCGEAIPAWTAAAAREYIAPGAGGQFDPHIVQVFLNMNW